ncbi:MAG TPA: DUF5698 domain-containing protein [Thermoanaerobaculia bacterium]|nr:DUF5698 domain-containing protein [Thermoanaerobaculia bacterium]
MDFAALPHPFFASPWFVWVVLPLFIFVARTTDIGLSTLRIVAISQGRSLQASLIGFFESLLWLAVISQVLPNLRNPLCVVAYAGGFAAGNGFGLFLERRLAMGMQVVRVITQREADELVGNLAAAGFGVTSLDAEGVKGRVKLIFTVVRRRDVPRVLELVERHNPRSFLSVEDVRRASEGFFPPATPLRARPGMWHWWRALRKTK